MTKTMKAGAGILLAAALALGGPALLAHADETTPTDDGTQVVATAPIDTPATAPATDTTSPVTDTPAVVDDQPADPAPVAGDPITGPPLVAVPVTKDLAWVLPNGGTATNVTWPQPVYDPAAPVACDTTITIQHDTNRYSTGEEVASVDAQDDDGVLTQGEDYGTVVSWWFTTVTGPTCPPAEPEPTAIVLLPITSTCDSYTVPEQPTGGKYAVDADGNRPVPGTFPLTPGQSVMINAHAIYGYTATPINTTVVGTECAVIVTPPVTDEPATPATVELVTPVSHEQRLASTGVSDAAQRGTLTAGAVGGSLALIGLAFAIAGLIQSRRRKVSE